ncbi:MAG: hypothetical protein Q4A69_06840 [Moraxella sp.]|nr:hypothetical protein [Moraxella sp.]
MKFIKPLSLTIASALLTACATTNTPAPAFQGNAKDQATKAISAQLRSAFGYQTDVYVLNQPHQVAQQTDTADCATLHDNAYVALAKLAKQHKHDISDDLYTNQRQKIRDDYLDCQEAQKASHNYPAFDFGEFYQHNAPITPKQSQAFATQLQTGIDNDAADTSLTKLDAKKAQLLREYLLKPSKFSVVGSYAPFQGKISALPMISYRAKNLSASLAQPIYLDINAQGVYLWADNFALANSQFIDKSLGDTWHNKWLFVPINDGSLPTEFAKDLLRALLDAQKERFAALNSADFQALEPARFELPFVEQTLPSSTINTIKQTPQIIKQQTSPQDKAYGDYVFADTLYNTITAKYPTLAQQTPTFFERTISEGHSVIEIANITDSHDGHDKQAPNINSEFLMRALFLYLKNKIDDYTANTNQNSQQPAPYAAITHYGINNGKLSWLHQRHYFGDFNLQGGQFKTLTGGEPIFVDSFTHIQKHKDMGEFNRLPPSARTPNAQNSVNVFAYKNVLLERLKNSDDNYLQAMLALLFDINSDTAAEPTSPEHSPSD